MIVRSTLLVLASVFCAAAVWAQTLSRNLECVGRIICQLRDLSTLESGDMIGGGTHVAGNERLAWFGLFASSGTPIWFTLDRAGSTSEGMTVEGHGQSIYVAGATANSANAFIRKLSTTGATIWERIIPGEGAITVAHDLSASPAGVLYATTTKTLRGKTSSIVLTALSEEGALVWERTAPNDGETAIGKTFAPAVGQVIALPNGCLVLAAKGRSLTLLRYSANGDLMDTRKVSVPLPTQLGSFPMMSVSVVEATRSSSGSIWMVGSFGPLVSWIAHLDPTGEVTWSHAEQSKGGFRYRDIAAMPDDSIIVVGRAIANDKRALFSARISPNGETLWSRTVPVELGVIDPGVAIAKSHDSFYVSGASDPMRREDRWLGELKEPGEILPSQRR